MMSKKVITPAPEDFCNAIECFKKSVEEATERFNNFTSVVRCKDCKYGDLWLDENVIVCDKLSKTRDKNWFCADGVRKEGR